MFIAKGLAEAQNGTLVVSSEGLGLGSTFCLILKLATSGDAVQADLPAFGMEMPANAIPIQKLTKAHP
jgi:hypothetical protein